ncbi:phage baseplate assembly protein V [Paraburkholderia sediminicola]|uniref:phage baseplate assembly protein V n=1 Tax=Paraburkholderia sediminicola TaxID=458836 RepID=UPI0038B9AE56
MSAIEEVFRRIQMMFGRGRVTYVDDSGSVQKVQVRLSGLETSDNRLRMMEFGFTSNPPDGTDVLALHISGDRSAGTVFATNHQQSRPRGLQGGETMLYSQDGKYVYMTASGGISVFANGQPVNVTGATTVTINASTEVLMDTPILKCTGDIIDNCNTNTDTMATMREDYDTHGHPVVNVQTGGSTITTGTPTVPM